MKADRIGLHRLLANMTMQSICAWWERLLGCRFRKAPAFSQNLPISLTSFFWDVNRPLSQLFLNLQPSLLYPYLFMAMKGKSITSGQTNVSRTQVPSKPADKRSIVRGGPSKSATVLPIHIRAQNVVLVLWREKESIVFEYFRSFTLW